MSPVNQVPALDDFRPPYHLGAVGSAIVGVWSGPPAFGSGDLGGFEPVRWGGGHVGAAVVLRYDHPPADHPVPYGEIILAYVVRRSAKWAAIPFDLVLDNAFYVEAGLRHYHLPKRLDTTLDIVVERDATGRPSHMRASGADVAFDASLGPRSIGCATALVSVLLRAFTSHIPVIGAASQPLLSTLIRVDPDRTTAHAARDVRLAVGGRTLRPIGSFFWEKLAVNVGIPRSVSR